MTDRGVSRREFMEVAVTAAAVVTVGCRASGGSRAGVAVTAAPLLSPDRSAAAFDAAAAALEGAGVNLAVVPIASEPAEPSTVLANLLRLERHVARRGDRIRWIRQPAELRSSGPLQVVAQVSGLGALPADTPEDLLGFVPGLRGLGVRIVRPVHCWKNRLGDGCFERTDTRLTETGRRAIKALAEAGILIDLSGMGRRSSLEALELAGRPVVFAAANSARVHSHRANLTDEQIDACARGGGVIGISAFPALVTDSAESTLADVIRQLDYVAKRTGVDHVALGLDFDDRARRRFPSDPLPAPPYHYPTGLAGIEDLDHFRAALASAGYDGGSIGKIMGGNFARVVRAAWEAP
jgi:membrane dipeptidase